MLRHYDDARRDLPAGGYDPRRLVSPGLTPGLCSSHASSSLTVLTKLPADRGYDQSEPTASITGLAPGSCANKGVQGVSWNQDYDDRPSSDRSRQAGCADAAAGAAVAGRVLDRGFSQTSPPITPLRPCLPAARRGEGFRELPTAVGRGGPRRPECASDAADRVRAQHGDRRGHGEQAQHGIWHHDRFCGRAGTIDGSPRGAEQPWEPVYPGHGAD